MSFATKALSHDIRLHHYLLLAVAEAIGGRRIKELLSVLMWLLRSGELINVSMVEPAFRGAFMRSSYITSI